MPRVKALAISIALDEPSDQHLLERKEEILLLARRIELRRAK